MIKHLRLLEIWYMMDIKGVLLQSFINFWWKTSGGAATLANESATKNKNISNKELAEELHKPIIREFKKRKVHSPFIDNTWGADLAAMLYLTTEFTFDYVLLIFPVNAHGSFYWKVKKVLQLLMLFKKS